MQMCNSQLEVVFFSKFEECQLLAICTNTCGTCNYLQKQEPTLCQLECADPGFKSLETAVHRWNFALFVHVEGASFGTAQPRIAARFRHMQLQL